MIRSSRKSFKTFTALATVAALSTVALPSSVLASPLASPPAPTAQPASADEVRLVSGGFLRGEIVEYSPGEFVVILPRGAKQSRRIAWEDISEVIRAGQAEPSAPIGPVEAPPAPMPAAPAPAPAPEPEPMPAAPAPAPAAEPEPEGALIHIDQTRNDEAMLLYHVDGEAVASGGGYTATAVAFSEVCESPCDIELTDHSGEFFVRGQKKYTASKRFRLRGDHVRYDLSVKPGSKALRIGGYVLAIAAPILMANMVMIPYLVDMPKRYAAGWWAGGSLVGIFGLGGGITMMILGRSKVVVRPGEKRSR